MEIPEGPTPIAAQRVRCAAVAKATLRADRATKERAAHHDAARDVFSRQEHKHCRAGGAGERQPSENETGADEGGILRGLDSDEPVSTVTPAAASAITPVTVVMPIAA